jgi:hypothetical protein
VFADCQSQPGAAKFARGGGVNLRENLEEAVGALRWDANAGISDGKVEFTLSTGRIDDLYFLPRAWRITCGPDRAEIAGSNPVGGVNGNFLAFCFLLRRLSSHTPPKKS